MRQLFVLFVALTFVVACGKKDDAKKKGDSKPTAGKKAGTPDKPKAPAGGPLTLTKVDNLKVDAVPGSVVEDGIGGGNMIVGSAPFSVDVASDMNPDTPEKAAEEATDMFSAKNLKTEKLADGWVVTFDNTGGMGANYFVWARREIDGKAYYCSTTASKPEQQTAVVTACKSLKK